VKATSGSCHGSLLAVGLSGSRCRSRSRLSRHPPGYLPGLCTFSIQPLHTAAAVEVPPTLARTLRSTNAIESMISICREHAKNVKRWRDGTMALRWCAAGMVEAGKQFRRVNGHLHLPALRDALERYVTETVGGARQDETVSTA
jgi:hypothetical protein